MGNALSDTCGGVVRPHPILPGGWPQLHRENSETVHRAWCLPFLPQPLSHDSLAIPSPAILTWLLGYSFYLKCHSFSMLQQT